jgi:uncharacterized damage-inducible protein DinB
MLSTLEIYSQYNHWANHLLFSKIENELSEEQLDKEIISSFPSLRKTVYHIWDAEFIWLKRLNGESPEGGVSKDYNGNFPEAKKVILKLDQDFIDFVLTIDEQKANTNFTYKNIFGQTFTNPIWQSIHHCMNHSSYHRGQIVTMMRQLGLSDIPATDFIAYCRKVFN